MGSLNGPKRKSNRNPASAGELNENNNGTDGSKTYKDVAATKPAKQQLTKLHAKHWAGTIVAMDDIMHGKIVPLGDGVYFVIGVLHDKPTQDQLTVLRNHINHPFSLVFDKEINGLSTTRVRAPASSATGHTNITEFHLHQIGTPAEASTWTAHDVDTGQFEEPPDVTLITARVFKCMINDDEWKQFARNHNKGLDGLLTGSGIMIYVVHRHKEWWVGESAARGLIPKSEIKNSDIPHAMLLSSKMKMLL